jgi:hypothetical protein
MRFIEVARPPRDLGGSAREIHRMLPGAAAGFEHIAALAIEEPFQHRPNRLMIAVKCGRIQTAVRLDRLTILAEFDDVLSHDAYSICSVIPGREPTGPVSPTR